MAKRARAVVTGLVLCVASAFVVSSAWQLTASVFWNDPHSHLPADPRAIACSEQLRPLAAALDRGSQRASAMLDATAAEREFDRALDPEWQHVPEAERVCDATPEGAETYLSLLRLRRGLEGHARQAVSDVGPLRRDFEARLR